jgi:hypothetical protein
LYRENRVPPEHPRAGVAHDGLNLRAPGWLIAVSRALRARWLVFLKRTPLQSELDVIPQLRAFRAKMARSSMLVVAVESNHCRNGAALAIKPA